MSGQQLIQVGDRQVSVDEIEKRRFQELFERGKLQQNFEDSEVREMEETNRMLVENLSVADRMMRRIEKVTFQSWFQDDIGDVAIETRLMTSMERFSAFELYKRFSALKDNREADEYQRILKEMKELAKEITVTPGMNQYFDSDKVSDDVIIVLIMNSLFGSIEAVGNQVRFFRKK